MLKRKLWVANSTLISRQILVHRMHQATKYTNPYEIIMCTIKLGIKDTTEKTQMPDKHKLRKKDKIQDSEILEYSALC